MLLLKLPLLEHHSLWTSMSKLRQLPEQSLDQMLPKKPVAKKKSVLVKTLLKWRDQKSFSSTVSATESWPAILVLGKQNRRTLGVVGWLAGWLVWDVFNALPLFWWFSQEVRQWMSRHSKRRWKTSWRNVLTTWWTRGEANMLFRGWIQTLLWQTVVGEANYLWWIAVSEQRGVCLFAS